MRFRDVTRAPPPSGRGAGPQARLAGRARGRGRGRAQGGAWIQLQASAAIAACAVPRSHPLPALPGRVEPGGVGSLAPRGTAASAAGPPAQRNVRRRDSPVSPRPRPWPWAAAGPGRVRSWCRHDTIAGQEGQVGRQGRPAKSPGTEAGIEGPPTAPPPAFGSSRRALTETATVSGEAAWAPPLQGFTRLPRGGVTGLTFFFFFLRKRKIPFNSCFPHPSRE